MGGRELLFLERVLYGDGKDAFNGVFALRLKGDLTGLDWSHALSRLQKRHAVLRARVVESPNGKPRFAIADGLANIPIRILDRDSPHDWQAEVQAAWGWVFDNPEQPMLRLTVLSDKLGADLVLAFHHCICDGGGGIVLVRELLRLLDDPDADIGPEQGIPMLEDVVPEVVRKNRRYRLRMASLGGLMRAALRLTAAVTTRRNKPRYHRKDDYLVHWKLPETESAELFAACSAHGITVNTTLCLAFLKAFREVRGRLAQGRLTCPVDIRRFVSHLPKDSLFSFGLVLKMQLPKTQLPEFWTEAKLLQAHADKQLAELKPFDFLMVMESLHPALNSMLKVLTYGRVQNDLMFSNMGRLQIPADYSAFSVDTLFSPTVVGPFANPTTVITSTFQGQLDFAWVCNERFIPRRDAEAIRDRARACLRQACSTIESL